MSHVRIFPMSDAVERLKWYLLEVACDEPFQFSKELER